LQFFRIFIKNGKFLLNFQKNQNVLFFLQEKQSNSEYSISYKRLKNSRLKKKQLDIELKKRKQPL